MYSGISNDMKSIPRKKLDMHAVNPIIDTIYIDCDQKSASKRILLRSCYFEIDDSLLTYSISGFVHA